MKVLGEECAQNPGNHARITKINYTRGRIKKNRLLFNVPSLEKRKVNCPNMKEISTENNMFHNISIAILVCVFFPE